MERKLKRWPELLPECIRIPLTKGRFAIIDYFDIDLAYVNWSLTHNSRTNSLYYAMRQPEQGHRMLLHRVIAERVYGDLGAQLIDHRDGDGLNCRRDNIRPASKNQNQHNRGKPANNSSGHKGVAFSRRLNKWRTEIQVEGRRIHLGVFSDLELAAFVYQEAAARYHGEFAHY